MDDVASKPGRWAATLRLFSLHGDRLTIFSVGVCLTLAIAALFLAQPSWLRFQDLKLYDILTAGNRPRTTSGLPVIVDIDDASLAEYGQWPWPRYRIGLLLAQLQKAGVRAVGLDMLFAEPDRSSPRVLSAQLFHDLKVQATLTGLPEALADYDRVLANVLRGGPFVLGYFFKFGEADQVGDAGQAGQPACPLPRPGLTVNAEPGAKPLAQCLIRADHVACPLDTLLTAAPEAGFFNIEPDPDGILRRIPLLLGYGEGVYPSLALATVMEAYGVKNLVVRTTTGGVASLVLQGPGMEDKILPLDGSGRLLLDYRGPGGAFPHVPAADVLSGRALPLDLSGKIVFVGTSAAALSDLRASPLDRAMPGVEVHATVADMIVSGDSLYRPDWIAAVEGLSLLAAGLLASALLTVARPLTLLAPFLGLGALAWYGSAALMRRGVYASPLCTLLVLGLVFAVLTFLKFWREERQKRFIHQAFARYVSPTVVSRIVARRDALTLSGEEQECTILFSDVRGFTSLSESLSPSQVVDLLQSYFTPMTAIITEHMGTLDKFIGDAIMAFWNAPVPTPGHRALAVRAALAMRAELERLNVDLVKNFGHPIHAGVGLHCGVVRVGNFGSRDLFNYTVIGDAVNLCSRLEGLTKFYGLPLLVSDSLADAAGDGLYFQEIDRVRVKGKSEPVTIHTVRGAEEFAARREELEAADAARARYVAGDFAEAAKAYADLDARYGQRLYAIFAKRAASLAAASPDVGWDGVFEHTSK